MPVTPALFYCVHPPVGGRGRVPPGVVAVQARRSERGEAARDRAGTVHAPCFNTKQLENVEICSDLAHARTHPLAHTLFTHRISLSHTHHAGARGLALWAGQGAGGEHRDEAGGPGEEGGWYIFGVLGRPCVLRCAALALCCTWLCYTVRVLRCATPCCACAALHCTALCCTCAAPSLHSAPAPVITPTQGMKMSVPASYLRFLNQRVVKYMDAQADKKGDDAEEEEDGGDDSDDEE
jgi:hypothetical protein